mmetsp:Transcript_50991/g.142685  ORF Transcript_50991/g.142685 Transcript_50991/m.142685 type:complete len:105 (+) Transcript_50991:1856-2170(+)
MGTEMDNCISIENLFKVGVVCSETMMRRSRFREEQSHGIPFITKRWLNTNKDISHYFSIDEEVFAISIEMARSRSPVLFKIFCIRTQFLILINSHAVRNIQFWG